MSAPASEDLRELERELEIAAESGETRSRAALQDRFELSAADLQAALDVLREHGKAVEDAPGEWRGPTMDETPRTEPPRVTVKLADGEEEEAERPPARTAGVTGSRVAMVAGEPTVRLTRSIAEALDADALGKVVQAALGGLEDGEIFVLEVTP